MYRHTQTGWWMIVIFGIASMVLLIEGVIHPEVYGFFIVSIAFIVSLLLFSRLTVEADDQKLRFKFGVGLIRKQFEYSRIRSISTVKNKWYWGWGVRWFGRGWLYNVAGLDAVEISLKNGRIVRIGTNDPAILQRFVDARLKS